MAKIVTINVRGGVAEVVEIPNDVVVHICDYDVEGCNENDLLTDEDGQKYILGVYENS